MILHVLKCASVTHYLKGHGLGQHDGHSHVALCACPSHTSIPSIIKSSLESFSSLEIVIQTCYSTHNSN